MQNASTTPRTATIKWTNINGEELSPTNDSDSVNFLSQTHRSSVYYTIQYSDGSTPITQNFYINTYNAYKAGIDYATPISIDRRINLANNEPMPDTWDNGNGKGHIYVRAQNSDGGVYKDETIEVTTNSAIYQAGLAAGGGSMRTATSLSYVINDNGDTDYSKVNVSYDKGNPNTLSITNAFDIGRKSYTNTSVTFSSNNTYTPGSNVRWSSVTVDVPVRTGIIKWTDMYGNLLDSSNDNDSVSFQSSTHKSNVYYKIQYSDGTYSGISNFYINTYKAYKAGKDAGTGTGSGSWKAPEPVIIDPLPETELIFTNDDISYWDDGYLVGTATIKHGSSTLDFTVYMPTDQVPTSGGSGSGSSGGSGSSTWQAYSVDKDSYYPNAISATFDANEIEYWRSDGMLHGYLNVDHGADSKIISLSIDTSNVPTSGGGYTQQDLNDARMQGQAEMYRYYTMDLIWNYNGYVTQITAYDVNGDFLKTFNAREGDTFR